MANPEENPERRYQIPYILRGIEPPSKVEPYVKEKGAVSSAMVKLALSLGVSPFGPPPGFEGAGENYHVDASLPIRRVRERWELSEKSYVVFSNGGSHELLERVITQLLTFPRAGKREPTVKIIGIAPQFPEIVTFVNRSPRMIYGGIPPISLAHFFDKEDEEQTFDKRVSRLITIGGQSKNIAIYLDNPNNPTGDVAKPETIKKLAEYCAKKGWLLIIDEAFGDALEDNESAIPLTEKCPNLIVLRSFSKIIGLPGERIGYAVMSPEVGERFENVRRVLDWSASAEEIAEKILDPEILQPHLTRVREEIREMNQWLLTGLDMLHVPYAHTHPDVPLTFINSGVRNIDVKMTHLSTEVASGIAYFDTDNRLSGQQIRVTTPGTKRRVDLFLRRLDGAMKAA